MLSQQLRHASAFSLLVLTEAAWLQIRVDALQSVLPDLLSDALRMLLGAPGSGDKAADAG